MWAFLLTLAAAVTLAAGHGRVLDPPGRGTVWRSGYNARANYDDDGLNCGGFYHQHSINGGKCGLCGDAYDDAPPRAHERGGIYDSGIIVGSYEEGEIITITVQITAHHMGYWEFRICPDREAQECFDEYLLELAEGGTKYYPENGSNKYYVNYKLPEGLTCDNCVLQWRYTCGNNWGECDNGTQGLGCGNQETFGACSDITIVGNPDAPQYVDVESLVLQDLEKLGFVRLLISGAITPHGWAQRPEKDPPPKKGSYLQPFKGASAIQVYQGFSTIQPDKGVTAVPKKQRINSKQPKLRGKSKKKKIKKKGKMKAKWMTSWGSPEG